MRHLKWLVVLGAIVALAPMAWAGSGTDRVTGGGQVNIGERNGGMSAGDTIALSAQGNYPAGSGQVQYIDRSGSDQTVLHGVVGCLKVEGSPPVETATLTGTWNQGGTFKIRVTDNDVGQPQNTATDVIEIQQPADTLDCGSFNSNNDDTNASLARGNTQVYNAS